MNLLDFIFPKRCLTCWRFGKYFCDRCSLTIRSIRSSETICPICERPAIGGATHPVCAGRFTLDGLTSVFRYDGIVKEAVKMLKYRLVTDIAQEFADFVPSINLPVLPSSVFIPIPLHPSRLRDRGFNQAEVLGKLLARRLHIPLRTDILRRVKKTTPQVEMKDRKERLRNMKNIFEINPATIEQWNNKTIILFDDVFTTGATMRAAGETLKRAGAKRVWALTMAR